MSPKTLTIFLSAAPYSGEAASTAMRLARAALDAGHLVNLFASADGVYGFTLGHRVKGMPAAETGFRWLMERGQHVELCGSCLTIRGLQREQLLRTEVRTKSGVTKLASDAGFGVIVGLMPEDRPRSHHPIRCQAR